MVVEDVTRSSTRMKCSGTVLEEEMLPAAVRSNLLSAVAVVEGLGPHTDAEKLFFIGIKLRGGRSMI